MVYLKFVLVSSWLHDSAHIVCTVPVCVDRELLSLKMVMKLKNYCNSFYVYVGSELLSYGDIQQVWFYSILHLCVYVKAVICQFLVFGKMQFFIQE